jgi:hypothetical protein
MLLLHTGWLLACSEGPPSEVAEVRTTAAPLSSTAKPAELTAGERAGDSRTLPADAGAHVSVHKLANGIIKYQIQGGPYKTLTLTRDTLTGSAKQQCADHPGLARRRDGTP